MSFVHFRYLIKKTQITYMDTKSGEVKYLIIDMNDNESNTMSYKGTNANMIDLKWY